MTRHPSWKARFIVGIIMLLLSFFGMIFTDLKKEGSWLYWRVMTPVYALLSIGLSLYLQHMKLRTALVTIWHEILHWIGLICFVYLETVLVNLGFISRFQAGVQVLSLLGLATFLAGVYIDKTFLVIGLTQGLLVLSVGFFSEYLYLILPLAIIAFVVIFFISRYIKHQKTFK